METKISYLEGAIGKKEEIRGFDVTVNNSRTVKKLKPTEQLIGNISKEMKGFFK